MQIWHALFGSFCMNGKQRAIPSRVCQHSARFAGARGTEVMLQLPWANCLTETIMQVSLGRADAHAAIPNLAIIAHGPRSAGMATGQTD